MAIEEEKEEDFGRALGKLYVETVCMTKKNKETQGATRSNRENDVLKKGLRNKDEELAQSNVKSQELQQLLKDK